MRCRTHFDVNRARPDNADYQQSICVDASQHENEMKWLENHF